MSIASFEALYGGICELAGFVPQALQPDANGAIVFSMRLDGVVVSGLARHPDRDPTATFMAEMGAPPNGGTLAEWSALLQANAPMLARDDPRFSRHPVTGEAIVQWACVLERLTVTDVYQGLMQMVRLTNPWRRNEVGADGPALLPTRVLVGGTASPAAGPGQAQTLFAALYQDVCHILQTPPAQLALGAGVHGFSLRYQQTDATVLHAPQLLDDSAIVTIPLGPAWDAGHLDTVTALLEANFALMFQPNGPGFYLHPAGGGLQLRYTFALAGASASVFLDQLAQVADILKRLEKASATASDMSAAQ